MVTFCVKTVNNSNFYGQNLRLQITGIQVYLPPENCFAGILPEKPNLPELIYFLSTVVLIGLFLCRFVPLLKI